MWYTFLKPVWKDGLFPSIHDKNRVHLYDGANVVGTDKKRPIDVLNEGFADEGMPHRVLKGILMIRPMPKNIEKLLAINDTVS